MIRKRKEQLKENTWAIEDLYENDAAWEEEYKTAKGFLERFKALKGRLAESGAVLLKFYQLVEQCTELEERLYNYAGRKRDEDTKLACYQAMYGKALDLISEIDSVCSFETPELLAMPEEKLQAFYKECEELKKYELYITRQRKKKEHILSEESEHILALASQVTTAPKTIYDTLHNANLKFPNIKNENGEEVNVTHGTFSAYLQSKDRRVRKEAFDSLYSVYQQFSDSIAAMLNAEVKELNFYAKARKYESTLHAALDKTEVPVNVYYNLIKAVHNNLHYMYRYIKLRKKLLEYEEIHMYDIYTPIVENQNKKITYEQAKQEIYEALKPLGEEYLAILKEGFENRWIDVYENEGKVSGAYSAGVKVHPFVLLNFDNTLNSEFTLAHEMGHAIHSYLSHKNQPTIYAQYKIFVAEVASTCNEALLMQHLLSKTTDKKERAYLINHFLDKFRTTLFRQTMFAEFELEINRICASGETLTAEVLNCCYHKLNKVYYGDDIIVDDYIDVEWAKVPHFYLNYYVYQYATGYSAAIALSNKILKEGKPAVQKYLKFLSGGCSMDPVSLLKEAGVDMGTAQPINEALQLFGELLDEMETLVELK